MCGVYISYPFCAQKCTFCNFASGVRSKAEQHRYYAALTEEVRRHAWQWMPDTVYWGGGTPGLMPIDQFHAVMDLVPGRHWVEGTIECAPGTIDCERIDTWRKAGINRVSLGVQSFVEEEARQTGRKHSAADVARDIAMLRDAGISNINVDLIAGLPGQTESSWETSLTWLERLHVPHVSIYLFEIDEDSALGKEALLGGVRYGAALLPDDDASARFYEHAVERLHAFGLERYEVSNFAMPGYESHHNLKYWRLEPYVGFGLDSHSFDGRTRFANTDDLDSYLQLIEAGKSPCIETSPADSGQEHFFIGLRQAAGIQLTGNEWTRFAGAIQHGIECGVLERDGSTLRLTPRGFLVSNEIFQEFLTSPQPSLSA